MNVIPINSFKWDMRFLKLSEHISSWSKDPSTKVGSVIINEDKTIVSLGFNGFPRGVVDSTNRYSEKPIKHSFVVHAEANAILSANRNIHGCILYSSLFTCNECAKLVIQSGIVKVVSYNTFHSGLLCSWDIAKKMYKESNVEVVLYERENNEKSCY